MKFWIWRLRVCFIGLRWHGLWVWSCIDTEEWRDAYNDIMTPEEFYIEGWCRE